MMNPLLPQKPPNSNHLHPSSRDSSVYDYRNSNYDFYDYYNPAANNNNGNLGINGPHPEHLGPFKSYNSPAYALRANAPSRPQYQPYTPKEINLNTSEYKSQFDYQSRPIVIDHNNTEDVFSDDHQESPPVTKYMPYTPVSTPGGSALMSQNIDLSDPHFQPNEDEFPGDGRIGNFAYPPDNISRQYPFSGGIQTLSTKQSRDSGKDSHLNHSESPPTVHVHPASVSSLPHDSVYAATNQSRSDLSQREYSTPSLTSNTTSSNSLPSQRAESRSTIPNHSPERGGRGSIISNGGPMGYGRSTSNQGYAPYRGTQNPNRSSHGILIGAGIVSGPAASTRSSVINQDSRTSYYADPRTATLLTDIDPRNLEVDGEDAYDHSSGGMNGGTSQLGSTLRGYPNNPSEASTSRYNVPGTLAATGLASINPSSASIPLGNSETGSSLPPGGVSPNLGLNANGQPDIERSLVSTPLAGVTSNGGSPGGGNRGLDEKRELMAAEEASRKRKRWILVIAAIVVLLAIAGGVVGAVLGTRKGSGSTSSSSSSSTPDTGVLDKNSAEIKALLNNPNLHKVFPGVDYTPLNTQYPDCLTNPPSQNNVTRDMAVLSQLTNRIRMYGNDCNQTEMAIAAIDRLDMKPQGTTGMHLWLGVWLDTNTTTNTRQMAELWNILDKYGNHPFDGVVVGNEVLFREDMTEAQLTSTLNTVRSGLDTRGFGNLRLATSDLGSNWSKSMTKAVDVVMSNIHPFFGGSPADESAAWTWTFWQTNDVILTADNTTKHQVISEVGWPSAGGNDCGPGVKCATSTSGSVAGIPEMNTFLEGWVCDSLTNGTDYFWFEAFDEPWKVIYNTPTEAWEDKWGLMDVNRKLKPGVVIPDCGGKTVDGITYG